MSEEFWIRERNHSPFLLSASSACLHWLRSSRIASSPFCLPMLLFSVISLSSVLYLLLQPVLLTDAKITVRWGMYPYATQPFLSISKLVTRSWLV